MNKMCLKALELAEKHYPKKKLQHALRVALYASEIARTDTRCGLQKHLTVDYAFTVGILHDLVEDTDVSLDLIREEFDVYVSEAVHILTKSEDAEYADYIDHIFEMNDILAFWVKKADMKDHLAQTETLTDKLKEKYLPVIHRFM